MKLKSRWLDAIIAESRKPGIDLPWAGKRNNLAAAVPVLAGRSVRKVRVPAHLLRPAKGDSFVNR